MGIAPTERSLVCLEDPEGRSFTYGEVDEHSGRIANLLVSSGIVPGDRVIVQVEKSPQAVFLYSRLPARGRGLSSPEHLLHWRGNELLSRGCPASDHDLPAGTL